MTLITLQDGKIVLRDGKVGTEQACCCECCTCANKRQAIDELRFKFWNDAPPDLMFEETPPPEDGYLIDDAGSTASFKQYEDGSGYYSYSWSEVDPENCTFSITANVLRIKAECYAALQEFYEDTTGFPPAPVPIDDCFSTGDPAFFDGEQFADFTWTFRLLCQGDQLIVEDAGDGQPTESEFSNTKWNPDPPIDGCSACEVYCEVPPKPQITVTSTGSLSCQCCDETNPLP